MKKKPKKRAFAKKAKSTTKAKRAKPKPKVAAKQAWQQGSTAEVTIDATVWKPGPKSEEIGELEIASGVVKVCDAGTLFAPVEIKLPKGVYEVRIPTDDRKDNVAAVLAKKGAKPVSWKKMGSYGVDAGMSGFFDGAVFTRVDKHVWPCSIYDDLISNHLDPAEDEGHAGAFVPYEETKFSACRSGGGDGVYPVFAGRDAKGDVVVVVTTF